MSTQVLAILVLVPTALVVVALFTVLWRARTSAHESRVALFAGGLLATWAVVETVLALTKAFKPAHAAAIPPIGINFLVVFLGLAFSLAVSRSLRRLLSDQVSLIRMNVWRTVGVVFLLLMIQGQVPALWALPAGIGDILVGLAASRVAQGLKSPGGKRRAIIFNLLGLTDLVVAVGLGIMTSPGRTQVFHTTPNSDILTQFPLALVPTFLVPLAFSLHVISLWQLFTGSWNRHPRFDGHDRGGLTNPSARQLA
jgi:hypothetical protein